MEAWIQKPVKQVTTPEGVTFSYLLAGPMARFLAWLLDFVVILLLYIFMTRLTHKIFYFNVDAAQAIGVMIYFVLSMGYGMILEWHWNGKTLGKHVMRLRVMDEKGLRVQLSQIIIRNLLRFVDILPLLYMFGGITCLMTRNFQRLGDLVANTMVIREPEIREPDLTQIQNTKYNSLKDYPHLVARLRQRTTPEHAAIALEAILRRDELAPDARLDLFHELGQSFKTLSVFPQEATDGLSDEQYVRNVVDVLFSEDA